MSEKVSLPKLVEALASSVVEAADQVRIHQLADLRRFFADDGTPHALKIKVPSLDPTAAVDTFQEVNAPEIVLVPANTLIIESLSIEFEIDISEISDRTVKTDSTLREKISKQVEVDIRPSITKERNMAKITLKICTQDPPEGLARLIHKLEKTL